MFVILERNLFQTRFYSRFCLRQSRFWQLSWLSSLSTSSSTIQMVHVQLPICIGLAWELWHKPFVLREDALSDFWFANQKLFLGIEADRRLFCLHGTGQDVFSTNIFFPSLCVGVISLVEGLFSSHMCR